MNIKSIYFFLVLFSPVALYFDRINPMEASEESELNVSAESAGNINKGKRHRKKNKSKLAQQELSAEGHEKKKINDPFDILALGTKITKVDFKKSLNYTKKSAIIYIIKLNILLNFLLIQESLGILFNNSMVDIEQLRELLGLERFLQTFCTEENQDYVVFDQNQASSEQDMLIYNLNVDYQSTGEGKLPEITANSDYIIEEPKNFIIINSAEAKALLFNTYGPLICMQNPEERKAEIDKYYTYSTSLLNHENKEISAIGRIIKIISTTRLTDAKFIDFNFKHLFPFIRRSVEWLEKDINIFCVNDKFDIEMLNQLIEDCLRFHSLDLLSAELFPHFKYLFKHFLETGYNIANFLVTAKNQEQNELLRVYELINESAISYNNARKLYKNLYDKIQKEIEGTIQSSFAFNERPTIKKLVKNSWFAFDPTQIYVPEELFSEESNSQTDYISSLIKIKKQYQPKIKHKKKGRNRNHRKKRNVIAQKEEEPESPLPLKKEDKKGLLTLPSYHKRIINRFNQNSYDPYHAYPAIIDSYITKYGFHQSTQNKTFPNKRDTVYCIPAQMKYEDGTNELALFSIAFNESNICYHRGFKSYTYLQLFRECSNREFDFDLNKAAENDRYTHKSLQLINCNYMDIYRDLEVDENEFCIKFNDSTHGIIITLFKSMNDYERPNNDII